MDNRNRVYYPGEKVVFRMQKYTAHPGPRAADVEPERQGENYSYHVDKYWVVSEVEADGSLLVLTRRGKQHRIEADDIRLRPAHWWEKWLWKARFPELPAGSLQSQTTASPS